MPQSSGSTLYIFGALMALVVVMLLMGRRQRKMMQNRYESLSQLLPGDQVVTLTGLYGTVVHVRKTTVDLMIADGIITTWELNALRGKVEELPSDLEAELEKAAQSEHLQDEISDEDIVEGFPNVEEDLKELSEQQGYTIPDTPEDIIITDNPAQGSPEGEVSGENSEK